MPNYKPLVRLAKAAQLNAHAPYSHFKVGAALLTTSGRVYKGCNVESSSYSLTICAERTAIFKAISEGEGEFSAIAITSSGAEMVPPCGACRQVLWDLAGNIDVILSSPKRMRVVKLKELLPIAFDSNLLARATKRKK
jgi:cytidine deaminase